MNDELGVEQDILLIIMNDMEDTLLDTLYD